MDRAAASVEELEARLRDLYDAAQAGDPTAPSELGELIWTTYCERGKLINLMRNAGLTAADAKDELAGIVGEFAASFVADVVSGTSRYDPDKGPLGAYIQMALNGDVLNEVDRRIKRKKRERVTDFDDVAEATFAWNSQPDDSEDLVDAMELGETLAEFRQTLTPLDAQCFDLMISEVRDTAPYAQILRIGHLPIERQRREVNKVKDRLRKRVRRLR